jgi:protein-S-isoprenylcysteine O-methyltransferase Ste14
VSPLYLHDDAARALVNAALVLWVALEIFVRWQSRARNRMEWTFFVVIASLAAGFVLGFHLEDVRSAVIDGGWALVVAGTAILLAGLALRTWAIHTLGRFFSVTVVIQPDHQLVDTGPYRWLRHPAYSGLLLGALGLGVALENWLSLLALAVLPAIGVLVRIRVEEAALRHALGERYSAYAARTDRLIPRVW